MEHVGLMEATVVVIGAHTMALLAEGYKKIKVVNGYNRESIIIIYYHLKLVLLKFNVKQKSIKKTVLLK